MIKTKNIIFDLGGVLLDIDYQKTIDAFVRLGVSDFENRFSQFKADELFSRFETGALTSADFYKAMMSITAEGHNYEDVREAWNAMLLSFRKESLRHLKDLSSAYKLFLFSNTNEIHHEAFTTLLKSEYGSESLDTFFIKAYYSFKIGYRKPNVSAYHYVLKDAGIIASETIFIDDTLPNVEAAKSAGIQGIWLQPGQTILDVLK